MQRAHCTIDTRKKHARRLGGVLGRRLLKLPIQQIIPDSMHCTVAIVKKLVSLLAREAISRSELATEWELLLVGSKCKVRLPSALGKRGEQRTLFQRWENAGPTWPQALAILRHRACFIEILERHLPEQEGRNRSIAALWDHFAELATLLMQADVSITEEAWLHEARKWGQLFVRLYCKEDVTPYIHIFVYHIGWYLERYHGIEKFATFALEAKHAENKARYNRSTNKARHCLVTAAKQQLEGHIRQQLHDLHEEEQRQRVGEEEAHARWGESRRKKKRANPSWAQSALDLSPRLAAFVRSSTHVAE